VPFLAAPGNHDTVPGNQTQYPDTLAYFLYWSQPLNGPLTAANAPNVTPLAGPEPVRSAFLDAAGPAYPRMSNFSFDYGNSHWTVLDGNGYVDWTDSGLRSWVENDLASARNATWRFVAFHQPGFNSSKAHFTEQRMRVLSGLFEKGGVDIVFAGHVHNYQRSFPMHFEVRKDESGRLIKPTGPVEGRWTLDKAFDGEQRTRPDGIIYLVTGAGGAGLYDPEQETDPASWQPFTTRFIARTHSLTLVDVNGKRLTARQISETGQELDRFTVTK
jgi:3',5'-cyclic AMP phosphodiesterase CpdA